MQKIKSADQTFHNGDGRQELGTVVTAEWLNAVQGEIVAAVEGAGMTLADNDNGQLLKAINKIAGDAAGGANNNANGKVGEQGGRHDERRIGNQKQIYGAEFFRRAHTK